MRGRDTKQASMLCLVSPESVVPADHPLERPSASGYGVSISLRRMIERIFGWMKTTANIRRTRLRGLAKTAMLGTFVGAAYNILRLVRLAAAAT